MLMIPPVRQTVNGSFCRILPPFVNSRRVPYILSICTRMLNSYIVHLKFSFICAMIQKRKQKSPSPSLSFLTNERSQHYEIHLHLQKSLPERFRQGLCREKGRQAREVFKEEPEASVTFSVEKKNRCVAEIMLRGANGTLFRAVCEDPDGDMRGAIDEATAQIERKIRKNKTRLAKNLRAEAVLPELPEEFEAHEEGTFDIVRTKRFTVKPMSVEEAILQMNLLGHSFFVFRNTDFGDAICVVYRRNNGGYGIIETEDDEE